MITRRTIIDILKNNSTSVFAKDIVYPSEFEQIADDIMTELNRTPKPKKECLSGMSRDGKHQLIISDDGVYCGICGLDLAAYNELC